MDKFAVFDKGIYEGLGPIVPDVCTATGWQHALVTVVILLVIASPFLSVFIAEKVCRVKHLDWRRRVALFIVAILTIYPTLIFMIGFQLIYVWPGVALIIMSGAGSLIAKLSIPKSFAFAICFTIAIAIFLVLAINLNGNTLSCHPAY